MAELLKRTAWLSTPLLVAWLACAAAVGGQPPQRVPVVDLLRTLIASGVHVLYSSELVPPTLDAPDAMPGAEAMSRVVAALAVHQLMLRPAGPRSYVVTRAVTPVAPVTQATAPAPPSPEPGPHEARLQEVSVFTRRYELTTGTSGEALGFETDKIEQVPGSDTDVVRALHAAPGLATNHSARPYVRGALLNDVLVEFDGIPLADPFHFKSFQSVISAFSSATVNRADVFTGGFPVRFGTRSGGVIDLSPRSVESGYEYSVGADLLSYDLVTVGRSARQPLDWLLSARVSRDSNALQPVGKFDEPKFSDVVGRFRWMVSPDSALTLGVLTLDDHVQLNSHPTEELAAGRSRDLNSWLRWDWTPSDTVESHTSFLVANSERDTNGRLHLAGLEDSMLYAARSFSSISLRNEWAYAQSDALTWDFGAEFAREDAELTFHRRAFISDAIAAKFSRPLDATMNSNQTPRSSTLGLFASAQRHWGALEVEAGWRLDGQVYQGHGTYTQLSPRINVRYDMSDTWRAYGSWGEFTQAQRVDEFRSEENQITPDHASRAVHLIAGVAHEGTGTLYWRLEAYRNHWSAISPYFDNVFGTVSLIPELEPDRVRVAPSDAEASGVELSAQRAFDHGLSAWGIYSFSKVADDVNGRDVPRSWDQRNAGSIGLSWTQRRSFAAVLLGWHTGWPRTPFTLVSATSTAPAFVAVGARNSARWGNYLSADLRLSTLVPLRYGELSLWFDATNVTNRSNGCCVDLNALTATTGVPSELHGIWSPRVINLGFSWRLRGPQ